MNLALTLCLVLLSAGFVYGRSKTSLSLYCCSETCSTASKECNGGSPMLKLSFNLYLSNVNQNTVVSVALKNRYYLKSQDIIEAPWKELFVFLSNSTVDNGRSGSYPQSVTVYLFGDYSGLVQFGWFGGFCEQKSPVQAVATKHSYGWWIADISVTQNGSTIFVETFDNLTTQSHSKNAKLINLGVEKKALSFEMGNSNLLTKILNILNKADSTAPEPPPSGRSSSTELISVNFNSRRLKRLIDLPELISRVGTVTHTVFEESTMIVNNTVNILDDGVDLLGDTVDLVVEAVGTLVDVVTDLLSVLVSPLLGILNAEEFLATIDLLLDSIKLLPEEERSSEASQLLQLLDIATLLLFPEGLIESRRFKVLVVNVSLEEQNGYISGIAVNGSSILVSVAVPEQVTNQTTVRMSSIFFSDLSEVLIDDSNTAVGSPVISTAFLCGNRVCNTSAEALTVKSSSLVRITLTNFDTNFSDDAERDTPTCSFWQFQKLFNGTNETVDGFWSQDGCSLSSNESNNSVTVCLCDHLTHFAVLLSPNPPSLNEEDSFTARLIGYVGFSISLVALSATILVYACFRSLWNMRGYVHINLCITLIISQLFFVIAMDRTDDMVDCAVIAVFLHYLFLLPFMWMLMEGVVLYVLLVKVFVNPMHIKYYILAFTVISYGIPLIYMGTISVPLGFALHDTWQYGYQNDSGCWLNSDTYFNWAFISPVIAILLINVGFFVMVLCITCKHSRREQGRRGKKAAIRQWLKVSITLTIVMGLTWIAGVLAFDGKPAFVTFLFVGFISLQGLTIFIVLVPLSKQVRQAFLVCIRDRVNSSSCLSSCFGDKLETWMAKSKKNLAKMDKQNGFQIQDQSIQNKSCSSENTLESPTPPVQTSAS